MTYTDEDRMRVARKLRERHVARTRLQKYWNQSFFSHIEGVFGDLASCVPDDGSLFNVLADLIEPAQDQSRGAAQTVDREALLKLADDMEVDARNGRSGEFLQFYAGEIRRCCGVVDE